LVLKAIGFITFVLGALLAPQDWEAVIQLYVPIMDSMTKEDVLIVLFAISTTCFAYIILTPLVINTYKCAVRKIGQIELTGILQPVWIDWNTEYLLGCNSAMPAANRCTSVSCIQIQGKNKTNKKIRVNKIMFHFCKSGKEHDGRIYHDRGSFEDRNNAFINPKAGFSIILSLECPDGDDIINSGKISAEYFLHNYCPFIVEISYDGKVKRKEYSVGTVKNVVYGIMDRSLEITHGDW